MSDYDADEIIEIYTKNTEGQITQLNKIIIALKTRIDYLEKELEEKEKIPVPKSVIKQILELEQKNRTLQEEINYYLPHVPKQVIINRTNKTKPTRKGGIPK